MRSDIHFNRRHPEYDSTKKLDNLRARDFDTHHIYLDYTGGGRYGASQLQKHFDFLAKHTLGNPHSDSPTSRLATECMSRARQSVLAFFNASPNDYDIIFTPNASGALRLVAESYPFSKTRSFLQLVDNHNSVNGIREFAKRRGASTNIIMTKMPGMRAATTDVAQALQTHPPGLFAYPAQSNFTGVQHPLSWIEMAHSKGWDVTLDAAAFASTNQLDLTAFKPDFVPISFYKIFGWPTGLGCLIARKTALKKLVRPWFAGGTIWAVSVQGDWHIMAPGHEAFEDGTINYLNLAAVTFGLDYVTAAGIGTIHTRVMCLTDELLLQMSKLHHANGQPAVIIYGPTSTKNRGATIAFNFLDAKGKVIDERIVERAANVHKISLRTGCFCNPGSGEVAFGLRPAKLSASFGNGKTTRYDDYLALLGLQSAGAIRISLGIASNLDDVHAFLDMAQEFCNSTLRADNLPERTHC